MFERAANCLKRVLFPVSQVFSAIGVAVITLIVPMTIADVFCRRFLEMPIKGVFEITTLCLVLVFFLTLGYCGIRGSHVEMDILTVRFPKRVRAVVVPVMYILTTVILGVLSWQLLLYAVKAGTSGQTSGVLGIPIYPFFGIATLGSILLTLVYLMHFLYSLEKGRKQWN